MSVYYVQFYQDDFFRDSSKVLIPEEVKTALGYIPETDVLHDTIIQHDYIPNDEVVGEEDVNYVTTNSKTGESITITKKEKIRKEVNADEYLKEKYGNILVKYVLKENYTHSKYYLVTVKRETLVYVLDDRQMLDIFCAGDNYVDNKRVFKVNNIQIKVINLENPLV